MQKHLNLFKLKEIDIIPVIPGKDLYRSANEARHRIRFGNYRFITKERHWKINLFNAEKKQLEWGRAFAISKSYQTILAVNNRIIKTFYLSKGGNGYSILQIHTCAGKRRKRLNYLSKERLKAFINWAHLSNRGKYESYDHVKRWEDNYSLNTIQCLMYKGFSLICHSGDQFNCDSKASMLIGGYYFRWLMVFNCDVQDLEKSFAIKSYQKTEPLRIVMDKMKDYYK